jgi:hypothetical protein
MSAPVEQSDVIRAVVEILDRMQLPYAIGGSIASSTFGSPRFTQDADITIEPFPGREPEFAAHFGPDFYVSVPAMRQANELRSSLNCFIFRLGSKSTFLCERRCRLPDWSCSAGASSV